MKKKIQRLSALVEILQTKKSATVKELAERLDTSFMTIRRDLDELQEHNIIIRSHGKAHLCDNAPTGLYESIDKIYSLDWASSSNFEEKKRIASFAASLIEPNDTIILDNGSTTDLIPDNIPSEMNLTVACYNLNILVKISNRPNTKIIFGGGYFHPSDQMFESAENIKFLESIRAHKLFLSASGIHATLGLTCAHDFEVAVKQTVLNSALTKILVADSSKFGAIRTVCFEKLDVVDVIVTDKGLSQDWIDRIHERGIKLYTV